MAHHIGCGTSGDEGQGYSEPAFAYRVDLGGPVVSVAAGSGFTCAVRDDGAVFCWGRNDGGQLGLGHREDIGDDEPITIGRLTLPGPTTEVKAGTRHACALLEGKKLYCWGHEDSVKFGVLLDDEPGQLPEWSGLSHPALSFALGNETTCAQTGPASVQCWGDFGQCSGPDGTGGPCGGLGVGGRPGSASAHVPPSLIGEGVIEELAVAGRHACVRMSTGKVSCWGANESGQLYPPIPDEQAEAAGWVAATNAGSPSFGICLGETRTCSLVEIEGFPQLECWGDLDEVSSDHRWPGTYRRWDLRSVPRAAEHQPLALNCGAYTSCLLPPPGDPQFMACWGDIPTLEQDHPAYPEPESSYSQILALELELPPETTLVSVGRAHICGIDRSGALHCRGDLLATGELFERNRQRESME